MKNSLKFNEKTINREEIYRGKIVNLYVDEVILCNKKKAKREIVEHSGAVAILPILDKDRIFLIKQFRKPIENELVELPAGKLEKGEEPEECAIRELEEEIGYIPGKLEKLTSIYTSPGFANEIIHIYLASDLKKTKIKRDDDEFMDILEVDIDEAIRMIEDGRIIDAKTIVGILFYLQKDNLNNLS